MKENFWKGKRVLVTGANGFLAGWLIIFLLRKGAEVVGIVRDHTSQSNLNLSGLSRSIDIVHGTICDFRTVERALNEYEVKIVFHLAAQAIVKIANRSPVSTFLSNFVGTLNILEAVRQLGTVERVIIASSDKVYGDQNLPYTENDEMLCKHPYDVSKAAAELIAKAYYETYFKPAHPKVYIGITRCANLYGGADLNFTRIVPGQILRALRREELCYNLCKRQFLYVFDAVNAYLTLAEKLKRESVDGQAFNFGEGEGVSMRDLVCKYILGCCPNNGRKIKANQLFYSSNGEPVSQEENGQKLQDCLEYPPGEIRAQFLLCNKAVRQLTWRPVYSLKEGLKDTILWYESWLNNKDMKRVNKRLIDKFIEKQRLLKSASSAPIVKMRSTADAGKPKRAKERLAIQEV